MTDTIDTAWVQDMHAQHYLQSWSKQGSRPRVIAGGEGSWFWDTDGKRYLDFQSQLVNLSLGHQHPKIVEAIKRQADKLCYIGPGMGSDIRSELAALMHEITPANLTSTFFTTGGAAANETAVRIARHYTGRHKIVARYRSYHGATGGAPEPDRRPTASFDSCGYAGCCAHAGPVHVSPAIRPQRSCRLPCLPGCTAP